MSKKKSKFMGVLDVLSSDSDDDSDADAVADADAGSKEEAEEVEAGPSKKSKKLTIEDLQRQGFQTGPSILLVKAPEEAGQSNWNWSSGREQKEHEPRAESREERLATQAAVTTGVEQSAQIALKAAANAQKLREEMRAEREARKNDKNLSFNQKEKRKRDEGKASRGKSYVEEEKRLLREHGHVSGFD